ncbi:hypothetical protein Adt_12268 [Abeliophyllum distichum]|uniref:Uncharacterized protein n=1 Tax=Abeliophyllum distichum TaxID=126358 RepID=A0ABD1UQ88_9LAMI
MRSIKKALARRAVWAGPKKNSVDVISDNEAILLVNRPKQYPTVPQSIYSYRDVLNMLSVVENVNVEATTVHKIRKVAEVAFKTYEKGKAVHMEGKQAWLREKDVLSAKHKEVESRAEQQEGEVDSNMQKLDKVVRSKMAQVEEVMKSLTLKGLMLMWLLRCGRHAFEAIQ